MKDLKARGLAAGEAAAARAREKVARALSGALPGVYVTVDGDDIVLFGRLDLDDPELRWIARLVR